MRLSGTTPDPRYGIVQNDIEWSKLSNGTIRQRIRESDDLGKTWTNIFDGYLTRDSSSTAVRDVLRERLSPMDGRSLTVRVIRVTYPPGASSKPHTHACPVDVVVTDGAVSERIGDGPLQTFEAGDTFYEAAHQQHRISQNASSTAPAQFLAAFICDARSQKENQ